MDECDAREHEETVYRVWNDGADYHDGEQWIEWCEFADFCAVAGRADLYYE